MTPLAGQAAACQAFIARLPDDLVPHEHRRPVRPASPYTAAFGSPPVTVRCGLSVPTHDPLSAVQQVDGVDWLVLPPAGDAERYVTYLRKPVVELVVPHAYLPADVLLGATPVLIAVGRR